MASWRPKVTRGNYKTFKRDSTVLQQNYVMFVVLILLDKAVFDKETVQTDPFIMPTFKGS